MNPWRQWRGKIQKKLKNLHWKKTVKCYVCNGPSSNVHKCLECNNSVHAICGEHPEGVEEGYGAPVICKKCIASKKTAKTSQGVKRKASDQSEVDNAHWWLKPAKLQKTQDAAQAKKDVKHDWGICVTCFRSGAHPDVFKLCRRDKSSVSRHITRRHGGKSNNVDVKSYYSIGETIKNARKYIENLEKKR
ncbi:Hypothetical predicted protein [Paramuricea clavata]|uniref:SCAN domain-containing protein n=1 Tax=Paramuricea clavata TaxID=317549 RepID=A0A6S7FGY6_PARCT|nr:Hypothetical predicted protein [Paramuricea clavata]